MEQKHTSDLVIDLKGYEASRSLDMRQKHTELYEQHFTPISVNLREKRSSKSRTHLFSYLLGMKRAKYIRQSVQGGDSKDRIQIRTLFSDYSRHPELFATTG